jgi:hypothetical protein
MAQKIKNWIKVSGWVKKKKGSRKKMLLCRREQEICVREEYS